MCYDERTLKRRWVRHASKEYVGTCGDTIRVGDDYLYEFSLIDGKPTTIRICGDCMSCIPREQR